MTVITSDSGSSNLWALTKGAPELLKTFLVPSSIPSDYDAVSRYHMALGQRVLAMGYKSLGGKLSVSGNEQTVSFEIQNDILLDNNDIM